MVTWHGKHTRLTLIEINVTCDEAEKLLIPDKLTQHKQENICYQTHFTPWEVGEGHETTVHPDLMINSHWNM